MPKANAYKGQPMGWVELEIIQENNIGEYLSKIRDLEENIIKK